MQCGVRTSCQHHDSITAGVQQSEHLLTMYAGSMAEGGRDPGVQSDTPSETEEHSFPLDTMRSMTQSLMDLRPPKQRGSCAGRKARRRISKRRGALEFLTQYEQRVQNRCTWQVKSLEESVVPPNKVARCEPLLTAPGLGLERNLQWILQNKTP